MEYKNLYRITPDVLLKLNKNISDVESFKLYEDGNNKQYISELFDNVETISSVPNIVENGAEGYTKYGTEKSPGTMLFAISGPVKNPGVYEMAYGNKMIDFLNVLGISLSTL
jgi:hypothetical protein